MALNITNNSKNSLSITNEDKAAATTWDEATFTWNEATGTWNVPGIVVARETKNSLTVSNEAKN